MIVCIGKEDGKGHTDIHSTLKSLSLIHLSFQRMHHCGLFLCKQKRLHLYIRISLNLFSCKRSSISFDAKKFSGTSSFIIITQVFIWSRFVTMNDIVIIAFMSSSLCCFHCRRRRRSKSYCPTFNFSFCHCEIAFYNLINEAFLLSVGTIRNYNMCVCILSVYLLFR